VSDGKGNVIGLLEPGTPEELNKVRYTPWGEPEDRETNAAWSGNPMMFAGREYDEQTRLYYNRARYYDPKMGRFIQEDPIGLAGGANLYAYASGDPVNAADPSGLCTKPLGLKPGQIGICVESFISKSGFGVPAFASNNRGPSSDGGDYKTSHQFIVDLTTGTIVALPPKMGKTSLFGSGMSAYGTGIVASYTKDGDGFSIVYAKGSGKTLFLPAAIDYFFEIAVSDKGCISVAGGYDGYPSWEMWMYYGTLTYQFMSDPEDTIWSLGPPRDEVITHEETQYCFPPQD
jgi:RHS repeat-associated protein